MIEKDQGIERGLTSIDEIDRYLRVENIQVTDYRGIKITPFHQEMHPINKKIFWQLLFENHGPFDPNKLLEMNDFITQPQIEVDIEEVHSKVLGNSRSGQWFTGLILYPLFDELLTGNPVEFPEAFDRWRTTWAKGIDPEKFRNSFSLFFGLLSKYRKEVQEYYLADIGNKPLQKEEASFLAGIFENILKVSKNPNERITANTRNKVIAKQLTDGSKFFTSEDLFHTTDLETLPLIAEKGVLSSECTSLVMDGYKEAHFSVSFHCFKSGVNNLYELGKLLQEGPETIRRLNQKIHLAFLNPSSQVSEDYLLYPPDSFWLDREGRTKIAGRYVPGFDGTSSSFPNKAPAYVLIGLPSTLINFVVLDRGLANDYSSLASNLPFYIPAFSYEGDQIC